MKDLQHVSNTRNIKCVFLEQIVHFIFVFFIALRLLTEYEKNQDQYLSEADL